MASEEESDSHKIAAAIADKYIPTDTFSVSYNANAWFAIKEALDAYATSYADQKLEEAAVFLDVSCAANRTGDMIRALKKSSTKGSGV